MRGFFKNKKTVLEIIMRYKITHSAQISWQLIIHKWHCSIKMYIQEKENMK